MVKRFHLQPLVELTEERSQAAAQALAKLKHAWLLAETKQGQLQGYLEEYRLRLQSQAEAGFSITQWRDYQAFIVKLEFAIKAQMEEVERCRQRWETGQAEWLAREREVKAYQTLRQRHDQAERRTEEKQDQRLQDEFARNLDRRRKEAE
jgi:flagellar FliJ protein